MDKTPFKTRCSILSELWMDYRHDADFEDFIEYNDLGLPLAYAINEGIVDKTDIAQTFINEAFEILLAGLNKDDTGFETVEDLLDNQGNA